MSTYSTYISLEDSLKELRAALRYVKYEDEVFFEVTKDEVVVYSYRDNADTCSAVSLIDYKKTRTVKKADATEYRATEFWKTLMRQAQVTDLRAFYNSLDWPASTVTPDAKPQASVDI